MLAQGCTWLPGPRHAARHAVLNAYSRCVAGCRGMLPLGLRTASSVTLSASHAPSAATSASISLPFPGADEPAEPAEALLYPQLAGVLDYAPTLSLSSALAALVAGVVAAAALWLARTFLGAGSRVTPAVCALAGFLAALLWRARALEQAAQSVLLSPVAAADADSRFAAAAGLQVHYKLARPEGASAPQALVDCLHGFGANEASFTLSGCLAGLAARLRAVAIAHDAPGFGLTERSPSVSAYAIRTAAAVTRHLLDAVARDERIAADTPRLLVGHSLGALVAVRAAASGTAVAGLVLLAPAVIASRASASAPRPRSRARAVAAALLSAAAQLLAALLAPLLTPLALALLRSTVRSAAFWSGGLRGAYADKRLVTRRLVDAYRRPSAVRGWDLGLLRFVAARVSPGGARAVLAQARAACARHAAAEESGARVLAALARSGVPVLIIHGEGDVIVPPSNSVRLASQVPGAQLVLLPRCGHSPQEEQPEQVLRAVERWWEAVKPRPAGTPVE